MNLDNSRNAGTHWVAVKKVGKKVVYFDSFGDLQPPLELMQYFKGLKVSYNPKRFQDFYTH